MPRSLTLLAEIGLFPQFNLSLHACLEVTGLVARKYQLALNRLVEFPIRRLVWLRHQLWSRNRLLLPLVGMSTTDLLGPDQLLARTENLSNRRDNNPQRNTAGNEGVE